MRTYVKKLRFFCVAMCRRRTLCYRSQRMAPSNATAKNSLCPTYYSRHDSRCPPPPPCSQLQTHDEARPALPFPSGPTRGSKSLIRTRGLIAPSTLEAGGNSAAAWTSHAAEIIINTPVRKVKFFILGYLNEFL